MKAKPAASLPKLRIVAPDLEMPGVEEVARKLSKDGRLAATGPTTYALPQVVSAVRAAAYSSLRQAEFEIESLGKQRDEVRRAFRLLQSIKRDASALAQLDKSLISLNLARIPAPYLQVQSFHQIYREMDALADLATLMSRSITRFYGNFPFQLNKRKNRTLSAYFISEMATVYQNFTGRPAPKGRSGPFVNLLAAAWKDLNWPVPAMQEDLEGWLGQAAEKHPDIRKKRKKEDESFL